MLFLEPVPLYMAQKYENFWNTPKNLVDIFIYHKSFTHKKLPSSH